MSKNAIIAVIAAAVVVTAAAAYIVLSVPAAKAPAPAGQQALTEDKSLSPSAAAAEVANASSASAAIDAAVDALLDSYGQDETVATGEDADSDLVKQDVESLNSLSQSYDEKDL